MSADVIHLYQIGYNWSWPSAWCIGMTYDPCWEAGSADPAKATCLACFAAFRKYAEACDAAETNAAAAGTPVHVGGNLNADHDGEC